MKHVTVALIVARPGPLRNSLQTLLTTFPQIEIIAEARDMSALMRMGHDLQPDLVLIEANLPENGIQEALREIKQEWTQTRCIVLVESDDQRQSVRDAGADLVFFKGYPASQLIERIEELLSSQLRE